MSPKRSHERGPEAPSWAPVRDILETIEQVAATGWYPARRELMTRLASVPRPDLPVWVPEADIEETGNEIVVCFSLPGVEKENIDLSVTEASILVHGQRAAEKHPGNYVRMEQPRGEFLRRVHLPAEVKPATAQATHRNGILRVTVERTRPAVGRNVKID